MDKNVELPPINERIHRLVLEKTGGNVSKFASHIGSSPQKIQRLFSPDPRNKKYPEPSLEVVSAIAQGYNVSIDYIVNGINTSETDLINTIPIGVDAIEFLLEEMKRKDVLNKEYRKTNEELRKRIDQLTDMLLEYYKNK